MKKQKTDRINYYFSFQADISHAYQTLLNNGIPADHIVVMMADDIAHNKQYEIVFLIKF